MAQAPPVASAERPFDPAVAAAVIATVAVFSITMGLSYPLLTLILEARQISPAVIGLNAAMSPLGIIISAPFMPWLARRLGAARLAILFGIANAAVFLSFAFIEPLAWWFAARLLLGVTGNGLYVMSETWVNLLASERLRGRIMAVYATTTALGFGTGPLILVLTGSSGVMPFFLGLLAMLAATATIYAVRKRLPDPRGDHPASILAFARLAPMLLLTTGAFALFDQGTLAMLPVYLIEIGMTERIAAMALTVLILGNVLLQVPIGWAADRIGRDFVLVGCAGLTAFIGIVLPLIIESSLMFWLAMFVWGSTAFGVYTLSLAELGSRFSGSMLVAGNAAFGLMWGIGGIAGAPATGAAIQSFGPSAMPVGMGLVFLTVAFFLAARRLQAVHDIG